MERAWWSYDEIAETYSSVAEPVYFTKPAAHVASLLPRPQRARIFDVGVGSGAVLRAVRLVAGNEWILIGIDVSIAMLALSRRKLPSTHMIAAALPYLPVRENCFDAVTASFVLSHVRDPHAALEEIRRVLKPGGTLVVTSWAVSPSAAPAGKVWQEMLANAVGAERLEASAQGSLPGERYLSSLAAVEAALREAHFDKIRAEERPYEIATTTERYVASRLISLSSRFACSVLHPERWKRFVHEIRARLESEFGSHLTFTVSVNFVVGEKPAA